MTSKQFFTIFSFLCCTFCALAQSPQAFNYQAVVRDAQGNPLGNQTMNFEISIAQNNTVVYGETQTKTTNQFGLVDIKVGQGAAFQNTFDAINWGSGAAVIRVKVNGVALPESPILSVPYALYALKSGGSAGDSWTASGNNIYRANGNVGIGTNNPQTALVVASDLSATNVAKQLSIQLKSNDKSRLYLGYNPTKNFGSIQALTEGVSYRALILNPDGGDVGIGIQEPQAKLHVNGGDFKITNNGITTSIAVSKDFPTLGRSNPAGIVYYEVVGEEYHMFGGDIIGDNISRNVGTAAYPWNNIYARGTTRTGTLEAGQGSFSVVEVRGADIVEKFKSKETIEAGVLVTIDENDIRNYKTTDKAYQKGIVGIVSGANGVKHGMLLEQEDALAGNTKVAIAGRVYVKATAQNGSIKAGDLLTSSDKSGYAMKSTNRRKERGAIVGKALTSLDKGEGFVLVLVGLQ